MSKKKTSEKSNKPKQTGRTSISKQIRTIYPNTQPSDMMTRMMGRTTAKWEEIDDLANQIRNQIGTTAVDVQRVIETIETTQKQTGKNIENYAEYRLMINTCLNDLTRFSDEFSRIVSLHSGKTGEIVTPEDTSLVMSIYEKYRAFESLFSATTTNNALPLTEYALEAADLIKQYDAEQEAAAKVAAEAIEAGDKAEEAGILKPSQFAEKVEESASAEPVQQEAVQPENK